MISTLFYLVTLLFSIVALCTGCTEIALIALTTLMIAIVAAMMER